MAYTLPELGYAYDALEPHFDAQTMEIHHSKHHQAYVNNANAALEGLPAELVEMCPGQLVSNLDKILQKNVAYYAITQAVMQTTACSGKV